MVVFATSSKVAPAASRPAATFTHRLLHLRRQVSRADELALAVLGKLAGQEHEAAATGDTDVHEPLRLGQGGDVQLLAPA